MNIIYKNIDDIKPYENNPRNNKKAVDFVVNSIKEFGFKVPLVISSDGVIVTGHTRYLAAIKLKMKELPCIIADDLSKEQVDAFRLVDNKVSEKAEWNYDLLLQELEEITGLNMDMFDFELENESVSYIDDLLEDSFISKQVSNNVFNVTFNFDTADRETVKLFLMKNSKEKLSDKVLEMAKESEVK
jgi:site-specific DNA-methyltransferase (adenine-specific)